MPFNHIFNRHLGKSPIEYRESRRKLLNCGSVFHHNTVDKP